MRRNAIAPSEQASAFDTSREKGRLFPTASAAGAPRRAGTCPPATLSLILDQ